MEYINKIYMLETDDDKIACVLKEELDNKGIKLASIFGFHNIPYEYKIRIKICNTNEFKAYLSQLKNYKSIKNCHAFSTSQIYVLSFKDICNTSIEEYVKMILHECVHILQAAATGIKPERAVWLYESLACYLSGQSQKLIMPVSSWDNLLKNFYDCIGAYAVAYHIGDYLFNNYSENNIFSFCQDIISAEKIGYEAYCYIIENLRFFSFSAAEFYSSDKQKNKGN